MASKQKNKKYTNKPLIVLIIVAIAAVVFMYWIINRGKDTKPQTTGETTAQAEQEEEPQVQSLINFNNTENAKISDGEKENISEEMTKEKTYQGLTIKDIKLKTENGRVSQLTANVENTSASDFAGGKIVIVYTKQDGSELERINGVLPPIARGESNTLSAGTTEDVVNAYSFRIEASTEKD